MKTLKIFLAGFALSAAIIASYAFVQESKPKVYDYVTIVSETSDLQNVTYPDGKFEIIRIHDNKRNQFSEDMKLINKFEKEGYELFSNNGCSVGAATASNCYYLLRKEHKE